MNGRYLTTFRGTPLEDIYRNLPDVDTEIDKINIEIFEKYEIDEPSILRHRCVLCKKVTCINDSISNQGKTLICVRCVYKYFEGDYSIAFSWNKCKTYSYIDTDIVGDKI